MMKAGTLQPKLKVGAPDDRYEREAEQTADAVMSADDAVSAERRARMSGKVGTDSTRMVQRVPAVASSATKPTVQPHGDESVSADVESEIERLRASGGTTLANAIRSRFEPRFGFNFGKVRVHTDERAARIAAALQARAFTIGNHLFFATGEYQPQTESGLRLIAHELTHVVQQTASNSEIIRRRAIETWEVGGVRLFRTMSREVIELPEDMTAEQVAKLEDDALSAERRTAALPKPRPIPEVHKPSPKPVAIDLPKAPRRPRRSVRNAPPKLATATTALLKAVGKGKVAQYLAVKGAPTFARNVGKLGQLKANEQTHEDGAEKLRKSEDAVVIPASDEQSKGNLGQVRAIAERTAPVVDVTVGQQKLTDSLAANIPRSIGAMDNFQRDKIAHHTSADVLEVVQGDKNAVVKTFGDVRLTPSPVSSNHEPIDLPAAEHAPPTPVINLGRDTIAPLEKEHTDVSSYTKAADAKLKEEGVTQEQLDLVDRGDLAEANKEKKGMAKRAVTEPAAALKMAQDERVRIDKELSQEERTERRGMDQRRNGALKQTGKKQSDAKRALEKKREDVATEINNRYKATQDKVTKRLAALETESLKRFDDGNAAAAKDFEAGVARELDAYKDDRYSGWFGWARKAKDWLLGMDELPAVQAIFDRNRETFVQRIARLVADISADSARVVLECKNELIETRTNIQTFVDGLEPSLQDIGKKSAGEMNDKLDDLDRDIGRREEELQNKLKDKQTEAIRAIDEKIEKMKEDMSGALAKVGRLLLLAAKKFFTWALESFGVSLSTIESIINKGIVALKAIFTQPIQFVKNLIGAAKLGFANFASNFLKHLKDAIFEWLTGELQGIELPETWNARGIVSVLLQAIGISWANIKTRLLLLIPAPAIEILEGTFGLVKTLISDGPMAAWEQIKDMAVQLKDGFISAVSEWIRNTVIEQAVKFVVALFVPGAGIVKAVFGIYDTIVFFIQKAKDIIQMVGSFLGSIADIAAGKIQAAADALENGLARGLKLVIVFLAKLLKLDGISAKIRETLGKVRDKVDVVIDRVAAWVVSMAKKAGKILLGKGDKAVAPNEEGNTPPATVSKHQELLKNLVGKLEAEDAAVAESDAEWLVGKRKKADVLMGQAQPQLEAGVKITIEVSAASRPRQFAYIMTISPNTSAVSGVSTAPVLTKGERYLFYVGMNGSKNETFGKFVSIDHLHGVMVIRAILDGERETERSDAGSQLKGKFQGMILVPAYKSDGSPNFRLANAASPEAPQFRLLNSKSSARGGLQPIEVHADPLALTTRSTRPEQVPPGLARFRKEYLSRGDWLPGHLVNGGMGGPGTNENLVPIDRNTNAKMRGNYENVLRQQLQLGKYFYFHAHVAYYTGVLPDIGRTGEFAETISIDYEEIAKSGGSWSKSGNKGSAGPYTVRMPLVSELNPDDVK